MGAHADHTVLCGLLHNLLDNKVLTTMDRVRWCVAVHAPVPHIPTSRLADNTREQTKKRNKRKERSKEEKREQSKRKKQEKTIDNPLGKKPNQRKNSRERGVVTPIYTKPGPHVMLPLSEI